jgi:hypothetical protein
VETPKVSKPKDPAGAQASVPKDKAPTPALAKPSKTDATRDVAAPEPPPAPVEAMPESPPLAAESAATAEVAKPEPAMPPPPDPVPAPAAEAPAPVSAAAAPASSYPNINAAPAEPAGKLLSPDERKKLIMKLNSLARRQGGNTSNSGQPCPEGASEADCKAAIE